MVIVIMMADRYGVPDGPRGNGTASPRGTSRTCGVLLGLALALAADAAPADTRLEARGFGNIEASRFSRNYPALDALLIEGQVVPGLHRGFVPQGIDFLESYPGEVVLSGYFCERLTPAWQSLVRRCLRKRSALYLFDLEAGEATRLALLAERDGTPMRRHAGGVAELHDRLWLPDNFIVYRFDLARLREASGRVITMRPDNDRPIGVDSSGDFVSAHDDSLWIGNFQRSRRGYPLPAHYRSLLSDTSGWTAGYRIDPETLRPTSETRYEVSFGGIEYEVYRPDVALHHRSKVQGITFLGDRQVMLSTSWGRNASMLSFHRLPGAPFGDTAYGTPVTLPDGSELRVQSLGLATRQSLVAAPPGAEGVSYDGRRLAIAFEGGAMPYRERWRRIEDRVLLLRPPPAFADRG